MGWFNKIFSGKQQRLLQMQQAQDLAAQQATASEERARLNAELEANRGSSQRQIEILQQQGEAALSQAAETARLAQQAAEDANYRASQTPADSEEARAAADRRKRMLQQSRGIASTIVQRGGGLGAPAVATQQLLGA